MRRLLRPRANRHQWKGCWPHACIRVLPYSHSLLSQSLTEFFRTHTFTTYSASKPPGHQHWVVTSLGRIPRRRPRASYRLMTHADFGREDLGSSRARAAPGAAEAAPPLRALRITVPLPFAHRRAELFHRARPPSRLRARGDSQPLTSVFITTATTSGKKKYTCRAALTLAPYRERERPLCMV